MTTSQKADRFAEALRVAQAETGLQITPDNVIVIWNDFDEDTVCGFKIYRSPNGSVTMATTSDSPYIPKLIRLVEDYMIGY